MTLPATVVVGRWRWVVSSSPRNGEVQLTCGGHCVYAEVRPFGRSWASFVASGVEAPQSELIRAWDEALGKAIKSARRLQKKEK